ncbi:hypothetical protein AURDEDRAFT_118633 [Auricularia subglabra TFB-10046 SS5]|nr:hypothetical protein AURDEDRAFT_118633 [Auricularia subglabra TFB-10046 SS5]
MPEHAAPPPAEVLRAFGIEAPVHPLAGGQSQSYTSGAFVLKLIDDPIEVNYTLPLLEKLSSTQKQSYCTPKPSRAGDAYIVSSWTCTQWVPGKPIPQTLAQWSALLDASRAFHRSLRALVHEKPPFLDERAHRWNISQKVAFGELPCPPLPADALSVLSRLESLKPLLAHLPPDDVEVDLASQLIHGDLAGNVLFAEGRPPAIIDFSPYWRPVCYAEAVVASDGLVEYGAGPELVALVGTGRMRMEMLLKAMVFRVISDWMGGDERMVGMLEKWHAAVDCVEGIMTARA